MRVSKASMVISVGSVGSFCKVFSKVLAVAQCCCVCAWCIPLRSSSCAGVACCRAVSVAGWLNKVGAVNDEVSGVTDRRVQALKEMIKNIPVNMRFMSRVYRKCAMRTTHFLGSCFTFYS